MSIGDEITTERLSIHCSGTRDNWISLPPKQHPTKILYVFLKPIFDYVGMMTWWEEGRWE